MSHIQEYWRSTLLRPIALRKRGSRSLLRLAIAFGLILLLVPGHPISGNSASAAKQISRFVASGDFASAFTPTDNGQIFVQVSRGGPPQNPQTFLFYAVIQFFPPVFISQLGSGVIPNSDLQVMGQKIALNTDTSAIPGFENIVCTPDESTCGPGAGGVITAEWNKTADFSQRSAGNSEFSFSNITIHSAGTFRETSASAQGTALGTPFQTTFAFIGSSHQVEIAIQQGN